MMGETRFVHIYQYFPAAHQPGSLICEISTYTLLYETANFFTESLPSRKHFAPANIEIAPPLKK